MKNSQNPELFEYSPTDAKGQDDEVFAALQRQKVPAGQVALSERQAYIAYLRANKGEDLL